MTRQNAAIEKGEHIDCANLVGAYGQIQRRETERQYEKAESWLCFWEGNIIFFSLTSTVEKGILRGLVICFFARMLHFLQPGDLLSEVNGRAQTSRQLEI